MASNLHAGKILWVDLTHGTTRILPTAQYEEYWGGRGINARLLYEHVDATTDPLGPENLLGLGAGAFVGTTFPQSGRTDVMCKSPVTGLIGNSNFGGRFGQELKQAGWDHIVLAGRAPDPVYLFIHNDTVEIRDARPYWGMETFKTAEAICADVGNPNFKVVSIGPAGERLVTYASMQAEIGACSWRSGVGAVMGSKNCKAIAVRGTKGVRIADPEGFLGACEEVVSQLATYYDNKEMKAIGHSRNMVGLVRSGVVGGNRAHETAEPYDDKYDYELDLWGKWGSQSTGCGVCPVQCKAVFDVPGVGRSEAHCTSYVNFDAAIRNDDLALSLKMTMDCQRQGLDPSSLGSVFQWLGILWERGIIDESVTDGCCLEWGNGKEFERLLWMLIERKGFGDKLADGMKVAADYMDDKIPESRREGRSTYYYGVQIHNNPIIVHAPVRTPGVALATSIGRRSDFLGEEDTQEQDQQILPVYVALGTKTQEDVEQAEEDRKVWATRLTGTPEAVGHGYRGRAAIVHDFGVIICVGDLLGTCKFGTRWFFQPVDESIQAKCLSLALGRKVTAQELVDAALRTRNLERALESKLGRRRDWDTIPDSEFDQPITHGTLKGQGHDIVTREGLERMKSEYYLIRGWDQETGIPYKETLIEYGLEDVADDLASMGILPERPDGESAAAMADPAQAWLIMDELENDGTSRQTVHAHAPLPGPGAAESQ
jgi:aldehyde:ferredoxin oxidoreductase